MVKSALYIYIYIYVKWTSTFSISHSIRLARLNQRALSIYSARMLPWRRRRQNAHPKIQMLNPLRRCSRTTVKPPLTGRTLLWVNDMCCCVSKHAFIHRLQTANGKCAQIPSGILTVCRKPLPKKLPLRVLTMRLTKPPMLLWMSL